jgi:hypothetical protein
MIRRLLQQSHDPEAEIEAHRQRLVRRNWRYSFVPRLVLGALLMVLAWELLRQNMDTCIWPWNIATLGVTPAATLSGVFASLLLAREQFSRSMRPSLSWASELRNSEILQGRAWTVDLMNFGPGTANVVKVTYSVVAGDGPRMVSCETVSRRDAARTLRESGLEEGRDFYLRLLTGDAPLPVAKSASEGVEFAALKEEARAMVRRLDFEVLVVDVMGDFHAKSLPFIATLPEWEHKHSEGNELEQV